MMFEKPYYSLEEASEKLGVDVATILHSAANFEMFVSIPFNAPPYGDFINNDFQDFFVIRKKIADTKAINLLTMQHNDLFDNILDINVSCFGYVLECGAVSIILKKGYLTISCINAPDFLSESELSFCAPYYHYPDDLEDVICSSQFYLVSKKKGFQDKVTLDDCVIGKGELKRLLALKAEHDNKPTYEQLQQQLTDAQQRISELEGRLSHKEVTESSKGKNTSLAIIHALHKMAEKPTAQQISDVTDHDDIGRFVDYDAIQNRLNDTTFRDGSKRKK